MMGRPLCRMCGMPVHRYSPDHPQHGPEGRWDAMGCVNMLKPEVEHWRKVAEDHRLAMVESDRQRDKARAEVERLREQIELLSDQLHRLRQKREAEIRCTHPDEWVSKTEDGYTANACWGCLLDMVLDGNDPE